MEDRLRHVGGATTVKRSFMEEEFVGGDPKTPVVYSPVVSFPAEHLRGHVCHTTSNASMHTAIRVVNSNIEVGQMGVAHCIEKDVVGFYITVLVVSLCKEWEG